MRLEGESVLLANTQRGVQVKSQEASVIITKCMGRKSARVEGH